MSESPIRLSDSGRSRKLRGYVLVQLGELLRLSSLQVGEPSFLPPEDLETPIRWVHVSDHPRVAEALAGGELLLTHGLGIGGAEQNGAQWVTSLAGAGVEAIGIRLGHAFHDLPESIAEACRHHDVILFTLNHRLDFSEVTMECHALILDEQHGRLRRALAAGKDAGDIALSGGGVQQTLNCLSEGIGNPVVLEDNMHRIVGHGVPSLAATSFVNQWEDHSRLSHSSELGGAVAVRDAAGVECVFADLTVRGVRWGRLHLLSLHAPVHPEDAIAVHQASVAIVASLAQDREFKGLATGAQGDLLSDIFAQRIKPSDALRRARLFGVDLSGDLRVIIVEYADGDHGIAIREAVRATVEDDASGQLLLTSSGRATVLAKFPSVDALARTVAALSRSQDKTVPPRLERIGVSGPHTLPDAFVGLDEASRAVSAAYTHSGTPTARYFEELGVERLFAGMSDGHDLENFVESMLGPLLAHDARTNKPLLPILETYLMLGASKTSAAKALYMSRRSVYDKLDEVERLTGRALDDVASQIDLSVALRALRHFRSRRDHGEA